jgi:hypothetical protein
LAQNASLNDKKNTTEQLLTLLQILIQKKESKEINLESIKANFLQSRQSMTSATLHSGSRINNGDMMSEIDSLHQLHNDLNRRQNNGIDDALESNFVGAAHSHFRRQQLFNNVQQLTAGRSDEKTYSQNQNVNPRID